MDGPEALECGMWNAQTQALGLVGATCQCQPLLQMSRSWAHCQSPGGGTLVVPGAILDPEGLMQTRSRLLDEQGTQGGALSQDPGIMT